MEDRQESLIGEFISQMNGFIEYWSKQDLSLSEKLKGIVLSYLEVLDEDYTLSMIDDNGEVGETLSGELREKYQNETQEDDDFITHTHDLREYWEDLSGDYTDEYRVSGFIFSMLVALDGDSMSGEFFLASNTDKEINIAGYLHESLRN